MRNFSKAKRVVVKIGTNILTKEAGIDTDYSGLPKAGANAKELTHKKISPPFLIRNNMVK